MLDSKEVTDLIKTGFWCTNPYKCECY